MPPKSKSSSFAGLSAHQVPIPLIGPMLPLNGSFDSEPSEYLRPTLDVVFKLLFAHENHRDLLVSLLTSVMNPPSPIRSLTVLNPECPKNFADDKGIILDILVELGDGTHVNVEMQSAATPGFRPRALFYWAKTYCRQLSRGIDQNYTILRPTMTVVFLNYLEFKENNPQFHWIFELRERASQMLLNDHLEIHFIELPRLKIAIANTERDCDNVGLSLWARFLAATTVDQLEEIAMAHPTLRKAKEALGDISKSKKNRYLAEARWLGNLDIQTGLVVAREEGREEGRDEGRREVLEQLLKLRFSDDAVNFVAQEVDALPKELFSEFLQNILKLETLAEIKEWIEKNRVRGSVS